MLNRHVNWLKHAPAFLVLAIFVVFLLNVLGILQLPVALNQGVRLRGSMPFSAVASLDFAAFFLIGITLALLLPRLTPVPASIITFFAMLVPFSLELFLPGREVVVPMEYSLLCILVLFSINTLIKYFIETGEKQRLIQIFSQYVPPEVVKNISTQLEQLSTASEAREMSVFFCDIRRFSSISEQLNSRELAQMLNLYFTEFTDVLHQHNATIDKYMGDAIMAFWGAPIRSDAHAQNAVEAGLAILRALGSLNRKFEQLNLPPIEIGIGINSGMMNVGNMGSQYRVAYTVVGDAVNLGERLEGLTRIYDVKMIVSEATMRANPNIAFRELDHVRVKGKGASTRIYEPIAAHARLDAVQQDNLEIHQRAVAAYYSSNWTLAESLFSELDAPSAGTRYYSVMRNRIFKLQGGANPDFDGVTNFNPELSVGT